MVARLGRREADPGDARLAGGGGEQPREQAKGGGLPSAIRAEERQALSGPKGATHAVDGAPPTEHPDEVKGLDARRHAIGGGAQVRPPR